MTKTGWYKNTTQKSCRAAGMPGCQILKDHPKLLYYLLPYLQRCTWVAVILLKISAVAKSLFLHMQIAPLSNDLSVATSAVEDERCLLDYRIFHTPVISLIVS